jgi:hypothetical protein
MVLVVNVKCMLTQEEDEGSDEDGDDDNSDDSSDQGEEGDEDGEDEDGEEDDNEGEDGDEEEDDEEEEDEEEEEHEGGEEGEGTDAGGLERPVRHRSAKPSKIMDETRRRVSFWQCLCPIDVNQSVSLECPKKSLWGVKTCLMVKARLGSYH